jgi:hypothetical protein
LKSAQLYTAGLNNRKFDVMMEYSAAGTRLQERKQLPPGTYEFKDDGEIVRVDDPYEDAANGVRAALDKFKQL